MGSHPEGEVALRVMTSQMVIGTVSCHAWWWLQDLLLWWWSLWCFVVAKGGAVVILFLRHVDGVYSDEVKALLLLW